MDSWRMGENDLLVPFGTFAIVESMKKRKHKHSKLIDALGGTVAVANLCTLVAPQTVSKWRRRGIPRGWLTYLREVRPEVFEE